VTRSTCWSPLHTTSLSQFELLQSVTITSLTGCYIKTLVAFNNIVVCVFHFNLTAILCIGVLTVICIKLLLTYLLLTYIRTQTRSSLPNTCKSLAVDIQLACSITVYMKRLIWAAFIGYLAIGTCICIFYLCVRMAMLFLIHVSTCSAWHIISNERFPSNNRFELNSCVIWLRLFLSILLPCFILLRPIRIAPGP